MHRRSLTAGAVATLGMATALLAAPSTTASEAPATPSSTLQESWENFQKVPLDTNVSQPMELDVADDGRVFFTERPGTVKIILPDTNTTVVAGGLNVDTRGEGGLQGIALDPDFATNGWVYLYYSALDAEVKRLSRFQMDENTLDLSSEVPMLAMPTAFPLRPAHVAGSIEFGPDGNLYLSTGDDTPPTESQGYAPIDERPGRAAFDAQGTSANTNDLRGKLLRVTPTDTAAGGYTIPEGNLFEPGTSNTRPEIYAIGLRNPFRFSVDQKTGHVVVADNGHDARQPNPDRGPAGIVEWQMIKEPGNYGWPYCVGPNIPFIDYDFATGQSGGAFDCGNPVNESPNNTGLTELPPSVPADVWYSYDLTEHDEFPELEPIGRGNGISPIGAPVYRYDPDLDSDRKFPAPYDGTAFFMEWTRHFVSEFRFEDPETLTGPMTISRFLPDVPFNGPIDMVFGPDGAMYVLEWGTGNSRVNPDAGVFRIEYGEVGERSPVAQAAATPTNGQAPLDVSFSSDGSRDPDPGQSLTYSWDFGDGTTSTEPNPAHTYDVNGDYIARLTITDSTGRIGLANVPITVGNTAPTVQIDAPPDGGFFDWGDEIAYEVSVTDPEDGQVDCADVTVQPGLGHSTHSHPLEEFHNCAGTFTTDGGGHGEYADLYYTLTAAYTDRGGDGAAALSGDANITLQPKHRQAEHFTSGRGVLAVPREAGPPEGGEVVLNIHDGEWIAFDPVNLQGIDTASFRVSAAQGGGSIELRADAPDGELLGTAQVPSTGGINNYAYLDPVEVTDPGRTITLYLVFRRGPDFRLDSMLFDDACPDGYSPEQTVAFEDEDSGVPNYERDDGCTILDLVWEAAPFADHSTFVNHVDQVTSAFVEAGLLSDREHGRIMRAAGRSDVAKDSVESPYRTFSSTDALFGQEDESFYIDANGADMWMNADEYGAIYLDDAAGPHTVATTKVTGQVNTNEAARAGLMIKNDITQAGSSSGYVVVGVTAGRGFVMNWDANGDGFLDSSRRVGSTQYPAWLRLERDGPQVSGFYSLDGQTWEPIATVQMNSPTEAQDIGIFATAVNPTQSSRAEFSTFQVEEVGG